MLVVRAIKHPAGLSFGATKVVSKVIGFLALQKQTSPSVCVYDQQEWRGVKTGSPGRTMCCFLLIEHKDMFSPWGTIESFRSKISLKNAFFSSLMFQSHCCCSHFYIDMKGYKSKIKSNIGASLTVFIVVFLIYFISAQANNWLTSESLLHSVHTDTQTLINMLLAYTTNTFHVHASGICSLLTQ